MTYTEDIKLAKRLCEEIKSGKRTSIEEVYDAHHRFFYAFIRQRIYDNSKAEDVFQTFWVGLMNGEIFCNYEGGASLRSYLCSILYRKIIDCNRVTEKERKRSNSDDSDIDKEPDKSRKTPEKEISEKEIENKIPLLIQEARSQLSEISSRDAGYIKMRFFEELEYRDIAIRELGEVSDEEKIKTKTEAIRKQFTRPETGSMAKFKIILERIMEREKLNIDDIFDS